MTCQLSAEEALALADLAVVADALSVPMMLVGANARRLTFDLPFGFASLRVTQDWDFAIQVANWEAFDRFYHAAVIAADCSFRPGDTAHRVVHKTTNILVDLVPFGSVALADGSIRWPQTQQSMSVVGFDDAFQKCTHLNLPNGSTIRLVTPALLVVLKLIAFSERGKESSRDLQDLWFILERYGRPSEHEKRVFDEMSEYFPDGSYYEHLGSLLLGWDIGRQAGQPVLNAISTILKELATADSERIGPLLPNTGDIERREQVRRTIAEEFEWLAKGIKIAQSNRSSFPN